MPESQIDNITTSILLNFNLQDINEVSKVSNFLVQEHQLSASDAEKIALAILEQYNIRVFPPITKMELFITENCTCRCDYCFVEGKNEFHKMDQDLARRSVDYLIQESRHEKELAITFFGGEPLLEFELMKWIVDYADKCATEKDKKISYNMTTNGILFTEESLEFCAKHAVKYLLSIDGPKQVHDKHRRLPNGQGSYDKVEPLIPRMKHWQYWMGSRMTIHPDTAADLFESVKFLHEEKQINQFLIGAGSGLEWDTETQEIYTEQMRKIMAYHHEKKVNKEPFRITTFEEELDDFESKRYLWGCRAGRNSLTISAKGEIFACSKMLGVDDLRGIGKLGDLDHGITDIQMRKELCGVTQKERKECLTCAYIGSCTGGCFAVNYLAHKDMFKANKFDCDFTRIHTELRKEYIQKYGLPPKAEEGDAGKKD